MEGSSSDQIALARQSNDRVKLNVGGRLFETTVRTLQSSCPDSLLAALSLRTGAAGDEPPPVFIDRDPEIFSALLSLLRSGRLPSAALRSFSKQDLLDEALYYGIEAHLRSALAPPPLVGYDAALASTICPASDAFCTALSAGSDDGSAWIAHGGQISAYDWNLAHAGTVRTHLDEITALRRVWPEVAAVGSLPPQASTSTMSPEAATWGPSTDDLVARHRRPRLRRVRVPPSRELHTGTGPCDAEAISDNRAAERERGEGNVARVYLEERSTPAGVRSPAGGANSVIHCYRKQVFVSKVEGLEVWSQMAEDKEEGGRGGQDEIFSVKRGLIKEMEGGGDRLFLRREGVEGIEVWESSDPAGAISLL